MYGNNNPSLNFNGWNILTHNQGFHPVSEQQPSAPVPDPAKRDYLAEARYVEPELLSQIIGYDLDEKAAKKLGDDDDIPPHIMQMIIAQEQEEKKINQQKVPSAMPKIPPIAQPVPTSIFNAPGSPRGLYPPGSPHSPRNKSGWPITASPHINDLSQYATKEMLLKTEKKMLENEVLMRERRIVEIDQELAKLSSTASSVHR